MCADVCRIFFGLSRKFNVYVSIQWTAVFYIIFHHVSISHMYFKYSQKRASILPKSFIQYVFFFSAVASFILVSVGLLFIFVLPISSLCRSFPFVAVLYFDFIYLYCFICLSIFVLRLYSLTALCFQCNISNCR